MFLSAVWTLILMAPIHCRGSIGEQVMECYISPNLMKTQTHLHLECRWVCVFIRFGEDTNSSTSWMAWGWVHFQLMLIFGRIVPLSNITRQKESSPEEFNWTAWAGCQMELSTSLTVCGWTWLFFPPPAAAASF